MHPNASAWWTNEFKLFFNPETGIDIDGLWIDMNEPTNVSQQAPSPQPRPKHFQQSLHLNNQEQEQRANTDKFSIKFCDYPCVSPEQTAIDRGMPPVAPPVRAPPRELPGFPFTQHKESKVKRRDVEQDLINPPYAIANDWPNGISDRTADTDVSAST